MTTLGDLKPGEKVTIARIEMTFERFSGQNPVFYHMVDGNPYYYINRGWTSATKISQVK